MRQKTINLRNQGSFDKKSIFFPDPKSHTQMGSLRAKNASEKFSRLGTFNTISLYMKMLYNIANLKGHANETDFFDFSNQVQHTTVKALKPLQFLLRIRQWIFGQIVFLKAWGVLYKLKESTTYHRLRISVPTTEKWTNPHIVDSGESTFYCKIFRGFEAKIAKAFTLCKGPLPNRFARKNR
jgi:hypothetical protein